MLLEIGDERVVARHVGLKAGPWDRGEYIVPETAGLAVVFRGGGH